MAKALVKVGDKVMATGGKLLTVESGSLLKPVLDISKSCKEMFNNYTGESIEHLLKYSDTENVEIFDRTFNNCKNLQKISIDTRNGKDMQWMFYNCRNIQKITLNTRNATNIDSAFRDCSNLLKLDITRFYNTSSYGYIFNGSYIIKALVIRSFGETYILGTSDIKSCYRLKHEENYQYNRDNTEDGYIYVPQAMLEGENDLRNQTNWSTMHFRPLEDYIIPNEDGTIDLINGIFDDEKAGIVYETD